MQDQIYSSSNLKVQYITFYIIAQQNGQYSYKGSDKHVQITAEFFTAPYNDSFLARNAVLVSVTVIVDNQQGIYADTGNESRQYDRRGNLQCLDIIGSAYGNQTEEQQHQHISHTDV